MGLETKRVLDSAVKLVNLYVMSQQVRSTY